jgi:Rrf2 family cysteine metabolism transcriptional repressor
MKILTKHTDYALAALCALAKKPGQAMNVAQLASTLQIPYPFLRGVFQKLSRARIVTSIRGQGGGYVLAQPEKVRVADVIDVFQGPIEFTQCSVRDQACPRKDLCALRKKMVSLEQYFVQNVANSTVADLLLE